jgi:hypothetical protein
MQEFANLSNRELMDHKIVTHGHTQQQVIVIDNFVPRPESLVEDASMLAFAPLGAYYPGVRAVVPAALVARSLHDVEQLIAAVFNVALPFAEVQSWYSLVTTPPSALAPIQRLPHYDSTEPERIALLHYLVKSEAGGTAFYRHRRTGYEMITSSNQADYANALQADITEHGLPSSAYISGDTAIFEQIAHYEARYNRAIIYRGHGLHCADIPANMPLIASPQDGRLTVNTFLHGKRVANRGD